MIYWWICSQKREGNSSRAIDIKLGRLEYDLERVWVLRRNEKNPLNPNFDEIAETDWIYDEEDGMFEPEDPEVAKYSSWE